MDSGHLKPHEVDVHVGGAHSEATNVFIQWVALEPVKYFPSLKTTVANTLTNFRNIDKMIDTCVIRKDARIGS